MTARTPVTWSEDDYAPFDQHKHLGEPPWSGPELEQWEEAHGHDARSKCYPEYGCMAVSYENDRLKEQVRRLRIENMWLRHNRNEARALLNKEPLGDGQTWDDLDNRDR